MGVQNIKYHNQDTLQERFQNLSEDFAKRTWIYDYFRVGEKIKKDEWMNAYLMQETLCTTNCEIVDYIWRKVNGLLEEETKKKKHKKFLDLNDLYDDYNIININNYITEQATWSDIQW